MPVAGPEEALGAIGEPVDGFGPVGDGELAVGALGVVVNLGALGIAGELDTGARTPGIRGRLGADGVSSR